MAQLETAYRVDVNVQPALKSLKDFKKEIEADAIALAKLDKTSEEYDKAAADLAKKQEQLNEAVGLAKNANQAAEGSYAALQKQMTALRKEWRETGDVARRNELGVQINKLNDQLKVMDKSIGVFNRNVGNYTGSVVDAFKQIGGTAGGQLASGINTANTAFKMLATNPIGAALTLLVPLIMQIVNGLKSSEDNAKAAALAFSGFSVVGDLVTKALQDLGKAIGWLGDKFQELVEKLLPDNSELKDRMEERRLIMLDEMDLDEAQQRFTVKRAKWEYEIAELRQKAADKLKYTNEQRAAFLEEAITKEQKIAAEEERIATMEYNLLVRKSKLAENSKEENDALAEAEAKMWNVRTQHLQKETSLLSGVVKAKQADITAEEAETKALKTELEKRMKHLDEFYKKVWKKQKEDEAAKEKARKKEKIKLDDDLKEYIKKTSNTYSLDVFAKERAAAEKKQIEQATFNAAKSSMDGIADLLEASAGENEKAVQAAKGLRAASATMDAFAAANSAYNAMASIPVVGPALGVAAAAAALASGIANVRQILATNTRTTNTASATTASVAASAVQAPAVIQEVAATRTLTTSTQEQQLNRMASDTRVYVVESDIAQAGKKVSVREGESVFR